MAHDPMKGVEIEFARVKGRLFISYDDIGRWCQERATFLGEHGFEQHANGIAEFMVMLYEAQQRYSKRESN